MIVEVEGYVEGWTRELFGELADGYWVEEQLPTVEVAVRGVD